MGRSPFPSDLCCWEEGLAAGSPEFRPRKHQQSLRALCWAWSTPGPLSPLDVRTRCAFCLECCSPRCPESPSLTSFKSNATFPLDWTCQPPPALHPLPNCISLQSPCRHLTNVFGLLISSVCSISHPQEDMSFPRAGFYLFLHHSLPGAWVAPGTKQALNK